MKEGPCCFIGHSETRKNITAALATAVALALAFGLGWHFGADDTDKKAYAAVWEAISMLPEPERCALCGNGKGMRYHAPCLVDLASGEVGELAVYTPHPRLAGEIAPEEEQQTGTFSFRPCAGLTAICDACDHTCRVSLPLDPVNMMEPGHFCRDCRLILAGAGIKGYLLIDLYDTEHIKAYPVRSGEVCTIRDYAVSVTRGRRSEELDVNVRGLLYQE